MVAADVLFVHDKSGHELGCQRLHELREKARNSSVPLYVSSLVKSPVIGEI
jgi:hypothetical protein